MSSPHRFLANHLNAAVSATLAASSVLPAEDCATPLSAYRTGTARAVLSGGYTGADDVALDIEIVSASGSGLLSEPIASGIGNGVLSDLTATALASQTFTVVLTDTGTRTRRAAWDFYGVVLEAKATGSSGNGITITVSTSGITLGAPIATLLESARLGNEHFTGPQWDFGAYPLTPDGELDSRSKRLMFGADPQVYRQYKTLVSGDWRYTIDPPLVRDLPAETKVYAITGTYTVTVALGQTTETTTGIVTLFDLLAKWRAQSALLGVTGVVVEDKTPGGMAAEDLPLRTYAYALPATYTGNAQFPGMGAITVPSGAPTQIITLACSDIATLGAERWSVDGSASGDLPDCTTGVAYSASGYQWTVPKVLPKGTQTPTGKIYVKDIAYVARPDDAPAIEICVRPVVAGALARSKTVEVVYTKKPPIDDCPCEKATVTGVISEKCLGVKIDGGAAVGDLPAAFKTRLETLYTWRSEFIASNTALNATNAILTTIYQDVDLANKVTLIVQSCWSDLLANDPENEDILEELDDLITAVDSDLAQLEGIQDSSAIDEWAPNTVYMRDDTVVPTSGKANGHYYKNVGLTDQQFPSTAYESGYEEPDWVTDGSTISETAYILWRDEGPMGDADSVLTTDTATIKKTVDAFIVRYQAQADLIRAKAGIVPKSEASGQGSACWQPCDGNYEWRVNGREYLPACTNQPYHSCILETDAQGGETIVSTQEFGFVIRCACPDRLKEGDRFTLVIENDSAANKTYQVGDTLKIPIVAANPVVLAGGITGNDTLTWTVSSSIGGSWPAYSALIGLEPIYSHSGLTFRIVQGGVPFELGDQVVFSVAGGTFKWRKGTAAWSSPLDISSSPTVVSDGISVRFVTGPTPAFVAGDQYKWLITQPHSPSLAMSPARGAWRWSGSSATWTVTFDHDTTVTSVALWHTLPDDSVITATGYDDEGDPVWAHTLSTAPGLAIGIWEEVIFAIRSVRVSVANAAGGSIRWIWIGEPWAPDAEAVVTLRESWQITRGVTAARMNRRSSSGEITWSTDRQTWLEGDDWDALLAMLSHLKEGNDEPLVFIPNAGIPGDARLVRIGTDDVDVTDFDDFRNIDRKILSVRLPLSGVPL